MIIGMGMPISQSKAPLNINVSLRGILICLGRSKMEGSLFPSYGAARAWPLSLFQLSNVQVWHGFAQTWSASAHRLGGVDDPEAQAWHRHSDSRGIVLLTAPS